MSVEHQDMQMFGLKVKHIQVIFSNLKLWIEVARHSVLHIYKDTIVFRFINAAYFFVVDYHDYI